MKFSSKNAKDKISRCIAYLHLIHKAAVAGVFQDMFEIKATTDARVRDDWSEDLGAVDKPSLPPALPQHVRRVCRGVGWEAGQG